MALKYLRLRVSQVPWGEILAVNWARGAAHSTVSLQRSRCRRSLKPEFRRPEGSVAPCLVAPSGMPAALH